jgi:hypothetical protein
MTALHSLPATCATETTASAGQLKPPTLVLNEPSCYHFRVLDPSASATLSATIAAVTIGHCYHM